MKIRIALALASAGMAASFANAQNLWASDSTDGSRSFIYELNPATGAVISSFRGPGVFADALSFTPDGQSIVILDSSFGSQSKIWRVLPNGTVLNSTLVNLDAEGLTILNNGDVWVGGGTSGVVARVNPNNGAILNSWNPTRQIFGMASNGFDRLYGLTIDGDVQTYDLAGNLLNTLVTPVQGTTLGLAFTGNSFYIASISGSISEVDLTGTIINSFGTPGPFTEGLDFPVQVPTPGAIALLGVAALGSARRRR